MKYIKATILFLIFNGSLYANDKLIVAVSSFEPWTIIEGNHISGIDIDLINIIGKDLAIDIEYFSCPWARCLMLLRQGKIDIATNLFKLKERLEYLDYFEKPYVGGSYRVFYLNESSTVKLNTFADLRKLTIGVRTGMQYFHKFDAANTLKKVAVTTDSQLIKMLKSNRIDTFIGQQEAIDYELSRSPAISPFKKAQFREYVDEKGYMAMSKNSKVLRLRPRIEKYLETLVNNGVVKKLQEKYR